VKYVPVQQKSVVVRPAQPEDDPGIAEVARRNAQPDVQSGADSGYTAYLRERGTLFVAQMGSSVVGYGATLEIGAASLLADLFVDPAHHGAGTGGALLSALWPHTPTESVRFTFASQDPRAISLYARTGLTSWWPLLYLQGRPTALPESAFRVVRVQPAVAAYADKQLTGVDRRADLAFMSGRSANGGLVITDGGELVAAGVVGSGGLTHLTCLDRSAAADAVVAGLRTLGDAEGTVCLPGPHPAVPQLLAAGYRIADFDIYMATQPDALATTSAYSPGLS
jgi:predicted N-acetyltransferase YhbS